MAVHSTARLFADDCIIYRPIRNNDDTILLQNDLDKIAEWEFMSQMQFNIDKCFILRVGRPKHKLVHLYTLHDQNVSETDSAKYFFFFFSILCRAAFNAAYSHTGGQARELVRS